LNLRTDFIDFKEGAVIDYYDFKEKIGAGAVGTVYRAIHKETGWVRAIKGIKKGNIEDEKAFKTELNIVKKIHHTNIVRVFETFETETHHLIVMEYCEGGALQDFIDD
jgi:calcium-dependent protein kinase